MRDFARMVPLVVTVPVPLTPLQKRLLLILAIVVGLTRLVAVAHSLMDWDEALFASGVREYDVSVHHPHPPGYPLFIVAAKFFHLLGLSEFHSLQAVVLLGALALFPAVFALARECGFDFTTSMLGALIYPFLPNVWVYGGTGFSDVPATALGLAAAALLLRGRVDRRAYLLGAIVLGISAGMRPQNLLIGCVPAILATIPRFRESWRFVLLTIFLGAAIVVACYGGAAAASSSFADYVGAVKQQQQWVHDIDSWHSAARPKLRSLVRLFFVKFVDVHRLMIILGIAAALSMLTSVALRRWRALLPLAIFGPFAIVAWLNLDFACVSRYSIGYVAMHAILAADGFAVATAFLGRMRPIFQSILAAVLIVALAVWTWPALMTQRGSDSPPAAAFAWIRAHVPPNSNVYVHGSFGPHATFLIPDHRKQFFEDDDEITVLGGGWIVEPSATEEGVKFVWPRNALWRVLRQRAFEVEIVPVSSLVRFGAGWYGEEGNGDDIWRWMSREGHATLPPLVGNGRLTLRFGVPVDALPQPPTMEVRLNGALVERFTASTADMQKSWVVPSRHDALNELVIATSDAANPHKLRGEADTRDLGLRLTGLSWTPANAKSSSR